MTRSNPLVLALTAAAGVTLVAAFAVAQTPPAPAAGAGTAASLPAPPAPGSPAIYKSNAELQAVLAKARAGTTEMVTSAVANNAHYRVNLVNRHKPGGALAHAGYVELHYIVEGSGTVVTGGNIVRPAAAAGGSATIEGGETRNVAKGDVVIVPTGSAHWYQTVDGPLTYLEVRFLAPKP